MTILLRGYPEDAIPDLFRDLFLFQDLLSDTYIDAEIPVRPGSSRREFSMTKTGLGFNVSYNLSWAANHKSVTFKLIGMTIFSIVIPGAARDSQRSRGSLYYQRDASAHSAPLHPE